jgi:hypothetical protein
MLPKTALSASLPLTIAPEAIALEPTAPMSNFGEVTAPDPMLLDKIAPLPMFGDTTVPLNKMAALKLPEATGPWGDPEVTCPLYNATTAFPELI